MNIGDFELGKLYRLKYPNDTVTIAKLDSIETYPSTGMPSDLIFKYISGDDKLVNASSLPDDLFAIPERLVPYFKSIKEWKVLR